MSFDDSRFDNLVHAFVGLCRRYGIMSISLGISPLTDND